MNSSKGVIQGFQEVKNESCIDEIADIVIVGSGAAGATAARVFSETDLEVVILEEGPYLKPEDRQINAYSGLIDGWREKGFQVATGKSVTAILQGCCVGGTTVINGAIIHRLPEIVHRRWCDEFGLADSLPYRELERIWEQMDRELGVGATPDAVAGENNRLMARGTALMGIPGNPTQRAIRDCSGLGQCVQGCREARKQSMDETYIPMSVQRGARLYSDCRALEVNHRNGRAVGVTGRFIDRRNGYRKGPRITVRARRAVLIAASAVHTPLLLAKSGIGRRSGLLGKRLQGHPGLSVLGKFDEDVKLWSGATQGFESTHFWDQSFKIETVGVPLSIGATRLPGFGPDYMKLMGDFSKIAQWGMHIQSKSKGRIRRTIGGKAAVHFSPNVQDVAVFKKGLKVLVECMFAAGARAVYPGVYGMPEVITSVDEVKALDSLPDDPGLFHFIMAHLFGTCLMGPDPAKSVVSVDGQSHELAGLYVLDSSLFPTTIGVNPQHTISAMSWWLSEQIAQK